MKPGFLFSCAWQVFFPPPRPLITTDWSLSGIFKPGRILIAFPLKLKEKNPKKAMCALASRDDSLTFRFRISFFLTQTQSAPAFQESRAHFPARNVKSIPRSQRKKCGLLEFFSSFFFGDIWRRGRRRSGCCSRSALRVCGSRGDAEERLRHSDR